MARLSLNSLSSLSSKIEPLNYRPKDLNTGIVHLGIGAFHRAHQAYYTHLLLQNGNSLNWGITGVSLRRPDVAEQLNPQDGLYTLVEQSSDGNKYQLIGAIKSVIVAPEDPSGVISLMASNAIKIVSLTVTEKGYCHDPATGNLNLQHPDIVHDLANLQSPKSALGFLTSALFERYKNASQPFTVLCCDNLPNNGKLLRGLVSEYASRFDSVFAAWIKDKVAFPCSMVDRIVPATTQDDLKSLETTLGLTDLAMVKAEPFKQWVIEDTFCNARPKWEEVGATFVSDVAPFEDMKLRLLNGSHSSIAYLGYLCGCEFVSDVMENPDLSRFVFDLMENEISCAVIQPDQIDLSAYKNALRERFANKALKHRTYQIAMDGSQKLPQRLLGSLQYLIDNTVSYKRIAFVLAAWMHYVKGTKADGERYEVQDPLTERFQEIESRFAKDLPNKVRAYLSISQIFDSSLVENNAVFNNVLCAYTSIEQDGMLESVKALNAGDLYA